MKNNKYLYGYKILIHYGAGWEYETFELSWKDARAQLGNYRENCPEYPVKAVRGRETNPDYIAPVTSSSMITKVLEQWEQTSKTIIF